MSKIELTYGDLIEVLDDPWPGTGIVQGVNCQNRMGSGFAKVIMDRYPDVKDMYHTFCEAWLLGCKREDLLGKVFGVECGSDLTVYNAFTQFNYGYDGKRYADPDAITTAMKSCLQVAEEHSVGTIYAPLIGGGLGGLSEAEALSAMINSSVLDIVHETGVKLIIVLQK